MEFGSVCLRMRVSLLGVKLEDCRGDWGTIRPLAGRGVPRNFKGTLLEIEQVGAGRVRLGDS